MRAVPTLLPKLPSRLKMEQSLSDRLGTRFRYWLAPFQSKSGLRVMNRSSWKDWTKLDCHTGALRRWSRAHGVMRRSLLLRNQNTKDKIDFLIYIIIFLPVEQVAGMGLKSDRRLEKGERPQSSADYLCRALQFLDWKRAVEFHRSLLV